MAGGFYKHGCVGFVGSFDTLAAESGSEDSDSLSLYSPNKKDATSEATTQKTPPVKSFDFRRGKHHWPLEVHYCATDFNNVAAVS